MPRISSSHMLAFAMLLASNLVLAQDVASDSLLEKRDYDSFKVFNRKRNGHACIMSIVFCVLYPLGGISVHLPIASTPFLRNTYLARKIPAIHMPIQLIALVMMVGGFGLGLRIAHDLGYFSSPSEVKAHMVIGIIVVSVILLFQPLLGFLQHRFFKRTGRTSAFGLAHRWIGRCAIILGIINDGLGLQLAAEDIHVPTGSYVRNFLIAGILVLIWAGLVLYDTFVAKPAVVETKEDINPEGTKAAPLM